MYRRLLVLMIVAAALLPTPGLAQQAFDVDGATQEYLSRLSPEQRARSDAYFEGGYWLQLWGLLYGLGTTAIILGFGISRRMRDLAERVTSARWLQPGIYAGLFVLVSFVFDFPLGAYTGFFREHQYGLSNQSFGAWMRDLLVGTGVGLVILPVLLMALYAVFRRKPQTWWIWGTGVALVFLVVLQLVAPVYIAPLFNTYTPVTDPAVREPVLAMARANGVPASDVFVFDASLQTSRVSANVSGLFNTLRVSLNDNLLNRTSLPTIQAVMGHELGHYVLNHAYEGMMFFALVLLSMFGFLRVSFDRVVARWGDSWGVRGIADPAGLPVILVLLSVFSFVMTPITNTYIRVNEAEADIFGLNAARQPDGFAEAALQLSEYRKIDPGPIEEFIFFDHPSGRARIHMAMQWKAEHLETPSPEPSMPPAEIEQ